MGSALHRLYGRLISKSLKVGATPKQIEAVSTAPAPLKKWISVPKNIAAPVSPPRSGARASASKAAQLKSYRQRRPSGTGLRVSKKGGGQ